MKGWHGVFSVASLRPIAWQRKPPIWHATLATGPSFAHAMTKNMLNQEWSMSLEQALEAEAQAQAICMHTEDFKRAYEAFVARGKPEFVGR